MSAQKRRAAYAWIAQHADLLAERDCAVSVDAFGCIKIQCFAVFGGLSDAEYIADAIGAVPDWSRSRVVDGDAFVNWAHVGAAHVEIGVILPQMPASHIAPWAVTK